MKKGVITMLFIIHAINFLFCYVLATNGNYKLASIFFVQFIITQIMLLIENHREALYYKKKKEYKDRFK